MTSTTTVLKTHERPVIEKSPWIDIELMIDDFFQAAYHKTEAFLDEPVMEVGRNNYNRAFRKLFNSRHGNVSMSEHFDWRILEIEDGDPEDSIELYIDDHDGHRIGSFRIEQV